MIILQWVLFGVGAIVALAAFAVAAFLLCRAVKTSKLRRAHTITTVQGIDEEVTVQIGGIPQHLYIRGQDIINPVILFLHGGPGGCMIPMLHTYQYLWEDDYTVVNWDQRGAGKTYFLNGENSESITATLSVEIMLEDLHEIALYLTQRFGKEKVILMGHSWGTILGSQFALVHPELVEAYVGIAQAVDVNDGVLKMAEYAHKLASEQDAVKDTAALEQIIKQIRGSSVVAEKETLVICKIAKRYMPMNMDNTIFLRNGLFSPYYTLREIGYYTKMEELTKPLTPSIMEFDLRKIGAHYQVPVIFVFGEYDWHMKLLAEEYYDSVSAPYQEFISIPGAGHVAMMDRPAAFFQALKRALQQADHAVKIA